MMKNSCIPETHISPDTKEWEEHLKNMSPKEKFWDRVMLIIMIIICIGSPLFIYISFGIAIYTNKPLLWYLSH